MGEKTSLLAEVKTSGVSKATDDLGKLSQKSNNTEKSVKALEKSFAKTEKALKGNIDKLTKNLKKSEQSAKDLKEAFGKTEKALKDDLENIKKKTDDAAKSAKNLKTRFGQTARGLRDSINVIEGPFSGISSRVSAFSSLLLGVNPLTVSFGIAIAGVGFSIAGALREASRFTVILGQQKALLQATGNAAGVTTTQLENMASRVALNTLDSVEGITEAQNVLLTFKNIVGDTFTRVIELSTDLASLPFFGSTTSAATALGKALQDPTNGMIALSRAGVTFSDEQKERIRGLQEEGNLLAAQGILLDEIASQVEGASTSAVSGLSGATDTLGQRWQEFNRQLNLTFGFEAKATSVVNTLAGVINKVTKAFKANDEQFRDSIFTRRKQVQREIEKLEGSKTLGFFDKRTIDNLEENIKRTESTIRQGVLRLNKIAKEITVLEGKEKLGFFEKGTLANLKLEQSEIVRTLSEGVENIKTARAKIENISGTASGSFLEKGRLEKLKREEAELAKVLNEANKKWVNSVKKRSEEQKKAEEGAAANKRRMEEDAENERKRREKKQLEDEQRRADKLAEQREKNEKRRIAAELKLAEKRLVAERERRERLRQERRNEEIPGLIPDSEWEKRRIARLDAAKKDADKREGVQKDILKRGKKIREQDVEDEKTAQEEKTRAISTGLSNVSSLMSTKSKELFRIGQAAALANAIVNTSEAISNALALKLPPPLPQALATAAGIAGGVQVAAIASAQPPAVREQGGQILKGSPVLVGERGPELIIPNDNGRVVNSRDTKKAIAAGQENKFQFVLIDQSEGKKEFSEIEKDDNRMVLLIRNTVATDTKDSNSDISRSFAESFKAERRI